MQVQEAVAAGVYSRKLTIIAEEGKLHVRASGVQATVKGREQVRDIVMAIIYKGVRYSWEHLNPRFMTNDFNDYTLIHSVRGDTEIYFSPHTFEVKSDRGVHAEAIFTKRRFESFMYDAGTAFPAEIDEVVRQAQRDRMDDALTEQEETK